MVDYLKAQECEQILAILRTRKDIKQEMKVRFDVLLKLYGIWFGPVPNGVCCQTFMVHGELCI
jgi:hypothetical protein